MLRSMAMLPTQKNKYFIDSKKIAARIAPNVASRPKYWRQW